jgi:hypothetical protein
MRLIREVKVSAASYELKLERYDPTLVSGNSNKKHIELLSLQLWWWKSQLVSAVILSEAKAFVYNWPQAQSLAGATPCAI